MAGSRPGIWKRALAAILQRAARALNVVAIRLWDKETPADLAMAALAERFPGAPDHWLRYIAERAPQLERESRVALPVRTRREAAEEYPSQSERLGRWLVGPERPVSRSPNAEIGSTQSATVTANSTPKVRAFSSTLRHANTTALLMTAKRSAVVSIADNERLAPEFESLQHSSSTRKHTPSSIVTVPSPAKRPRILVLPSSTEIRDVSKPAAMPRSDFVQAQADLSSVPAATPREKSEIRLVERPEVADRQSTGHGNNSQPFDRRPADTAVSREPRWASLMQSVRNMSPLRAAEISRVNKEFGVPSDGLERFSAEVTKSWVGTGSDRTAASATLYSRYSIGMDKASALPRDQTPEPSPAGRVFAADRKVSNRHSLLSSEAQPLVWPELPSWQANIPETSTQGRDMARLRSEQDYGLWSA